MEYIQNISEGYSKFFKRSENNSQLGGSIPKKIKVLNFHLKLMYNRDENEKKERLKEENRINKVISRMAISSSLDLPKTFVYTEVKEEPKEKEKQNISLQREINKSKKRMLQTFTMNLDQL